MKIDVPVKVGDPFIINGELHFVDCYQFFRDEAGSLCRIEICFEEPGVFISFEVKNNGT